MKRVLITGATGFIGRYTIASLLAQDYEVHAVSSQRVEAIQRIHWHCADLLDGDETERVIAEVLPSHLLHFAWYTEPGKFWHSSENFRWLEASIVLMRKFCEFGGKRLVMAGTCAEYDWQYGYCSEKLTPRRPATPYGVCKNVLQETLGAYSAEKGLSSSWGRVFFLYGPNEHPARLMSSVITALLRGDTAKCTVGTQLRDFLHVKDVASAFVALLHSDVVGPVNIASGRAVSLRELVIAAADVLNARERVHFGAIATPPNEPPLLVGDNRRLREEVNWTQEWDLDLGIRQMVAWKKSQFYEEAK